MAGTVASNLLAVVVTPITALVIGILSRAISRGRPKSVEADSGVIAPERLSAIFTVTVAAFFVIGGVVAALAGGVAVVYGAVAIAFGTVIGGFMAPSLTDLHIVRWTADGVEGPSKTFGLTLGIERVAIGWRDIARCGKTGTGYWYVESEDGRRVYWSYLYKGYGAFLLALAKHCPSLVLPEDAA